MLTRLGEAGADAFAIKEIAGRSSITISSATCTYGQSIGSVSLRDWKSTTGKRGSKVFPKVKKREVVKMTVSN